MASPLKSCNSGSNAEVTMEPTDDVESLKRIQIANEGMRLLLSSRLKEAEELFRSCRYQGIQLNAGHSFVALVKALMSFEDEDLDKAYKLLEATEKYCTGTQSFSSKLRKSNSQQEQLTTYDRISRRTIVADCLLFEAVLVFLKQGFTSYVKGGYILRKAWKLYDKLYQDVEDICQSPCPIIVGGMSRVDQHIGTSLYDKTDKVNNGSGTDGDDTIDALEASLPGLLTGISDAVQKIEEEVEGEIDAPLEEPCSEVRDNGECQSNSENSTDGQGDDMTSSGCCLPEVPHSRIQTLESEDIRLRASLYFGYGLMNIIVSLIPPKLMKVANLFGFRGSRKIGLQALEFTCKSQDMKAPLARLALLWYHTIVRPFFALDGEQEDAGAAEALRLVQEAESIYPESAFFLYFRGKIGYLQSNLDGALVAYSNAASLAREQREIEHICLFEKGWIHLLQLQLDEALPCFVRLKNETRWSASFYSYLAAVVAGATGDLKQARELFLQTGKLVKRKNNNLEKFCSRRASVYKSGQSQFMNIEMTLMIVELIYLWRALPFCSEVAKLRLLDMLECATASNTLPFHQGLRSLLKGCVLMALDKYKEAETHLEDAARMERSIRHDKHIMSFAYYELAIIHINRDEFARARLLLAHAKDAFSGYEFEARLNFKVHSAMALCR